MKFTNKVEDTGPCTYRVFVFGFAFDDRKTETEMLYIPFF